MKIIKMQHITREFVRANQDKAFLFGDNLCRSGMGGQAKEIRGEFNSFGIATKRTPSTHDGAFFHDYEFDEQCREIDRDIDRVANSHFETVVIPAAGLGTGLAEMDKRAPRTFAYLQQKLAELEVM